MGIGCPLRKRAVERGIPSFYISSGALAAQESRIGDSEIMLNYVLVIFLMGD